MYSEAFCEIYNVFGWNYFPEAFGAQLLTWLQRNNVTVRTSMDLACGSGVLCEVLHAAGIKAAGMDFSEGMIKVAKSRCSEIDYEVADMILYRPEKKFDLVTCTGDALNHILNLEDVGKIFENIYAYLEDSGWFIFDLLNEKEIPSDEPIDLDFSETVKAQFRITRDAEGVINLKTTTYENGSFKFEENIREIVHDKDAVCALLKKAGFTIHQCAHYLLEDTQQQAATWYIIARK